MPDARGHTRTRTHPGPAPHTTTPGEPAQWAVGIFLEALPALGQLVITQPHVKRLQTTQTYTFRPQLSVSLIQLPSVRSQMWPLQTQPAYEQVGQRGESPEKRDNDLNGSWS